MKSMTMRTRAVAAAVLLGGVEATACGADDATGLNECDIVTQVTNIKDTYFVGEVTNISVSYQTRNPSASCVAGLRVDPRYSTSASEIASFTPTGQLILIAPGVVTVGFGARTAEPFSKTITVLAISSTRR